MKGFPLGSSPLPKNIARLVGKWRAALGRSERSTGTRLVYIKCREYTK